MKNSFGNSLTITVFGESHAEHIGAVLDGLPSGISVNEDNIKKHLDKRRGLAEISSARRENDEFSVLSGVYNGYTTGTPLCITVKNSCRKPKDYDNLKGIARPGHADYTASLKYLGYDDNRGGGHQSGRLTAALTAAGSILIDALEEKGIYIITHIHSSNDIFDRQIDFSNIEAERRILETNGFPMLDMNMADKLKYSIISAKESGNSIGGILETAIINLPGGVGEPWFDTVEGVLSHILYSVPAVKGVEFGCGFAFSAMTGKEANDEFYYDENCNAVASTNNNGGVNGGISNGMPVTFKTAVKPTPSIALKQNTINFNDRKNVPLEIRGRHDPCIVHKAAEVINAVSAIAIADLLAVRYGTNWFSVI